MHKMHWIRLCEHFNLSSSRTSVPIPAAIFSSEFKIRRRYDAKIERESSTLAVLAIMSYQTKKTWPPRRHSQRSRINLRRFFSTILENCVLLASEVEIYAPKTKTSASSC